MLAFLTKSLIVITARKPFPAYFLLIGLCLLGSLSLANTLPRVSYQVTPQVPGDYTRFSITMTVQGSPSGTTLLTIPFEEDRDRPQDHIRIVEVFNARNHGLMAGDSTLYRVHHAPNALLHVRYTLSNALNDSAPALNEVYAQMLTSKYFYLLGNYAWITPRDTSHTVYEIEMLWDGFPAAWNFLSSFASNQRKARFNTTIGDFKNAIYTGGDIRIHQLRINGRPLYFGIRGEWSFSDNEVFDIIQKTVAAQRKFWNDYDVDRYTIALIPMKYSSESDRSINGRGLTNTFVTVGTNTKAFGLEDLVYLYNHELMHHWFGHVMKQPEPENDYKWFFEGFTDYFAHRVMLESGLWDSVEHTERFNLVLSAYYADSSHQWPNQRLAKDYWSSYEIQKLPYQRGQIFGLYLDESIQHYSQNRSSLKMVVQQMMNQTKTSQTNFSVAWLLQTLKAATGRDYSPEFNRFIVDGQFISMADWQMVTSSVLAFPVKLFDLGFQIDRERIALNANITRVEPGSNAEKAGLRSGDVLAGFSTTYKPTEPTTIVVVRGGEKVRITYFASREIIVPQLH